MSTSIDLRTAFPIVERANATYGAALGCVSALEDYDAYCKTRRAADCALELAIMQIDAAVQDKGSETAIRIAGIRSTSTSGLSGALRNWLTTARKKLAAIEGIEAHYPLPGSMEAALHGGLGRDEMPSYRHPFREEDCPGHVASALDSKICARCGIHIDALRPDEDDPFNPHGSGPVPIEPWEG